MNTRQFVSKLGILAHPGFRYNRELQGYRDYTFGCVAGPSEPDLYNLAHELGHAAQFGPEAFRYRATQTGFHFKTRRIWVYDRYCLEPRTNQGILRELETFAYQAHLLEAGGVKLNMPNFLKDAAHLMVSYMPDWYNIPGGNNEERQAWCVAKIEQFYTGVNQGVALARLNGWLDCTAKRLRRVKQNATPQAGINLG